MEQIEVWGGFEQEMFEQNNIGEEPPGSGPEWTEWKLRKTELEAEAAQRLAEAEEAKAAVEVLFGGLENDIPGRPGKKVGKAIARIARMV